MTLWRGSARPKCIIVRLLPSEWSVTPETFHRRSPAAAALIFASLCAPALHGQIVPSSSAPVLASAADEISSSLPDAPGRHTDDQQQNAQQPNDPKAANAGQQRHSETAEPQQTKRILGIMPNFSSVSADQKLPPLSVKDKFVLAGRNSFDYSSFILAAVQAEVSRNSNSYPGFHTSAVGYGRYYLLTLVDTADENFMCA